MLFFFASIVSLVMFDQFTTMSFVSIFFSWYTWAGILALPVPILLSDVKTWWSMPPGPIPIPFIGNKLPKNKPVSMVLSSYSSFLAIFAHETLGVVSENCHSDLQNPLFRTKADLM